MGPGDLIAYIGAESDRRQDNKAYVETVHRLTGAGAVVTYAAHETSHEGFDAEWRGIAVFTVEGDMINRTEVFDEADLDAAIAQFDQLSRPAPRLENTASQAYELMQERFAGRDWDAMADGFAEEIFHDDRRRVVGAGLREGRSAVVAEFAVFAEIGVKRMTSDTIAIRGSQLVLSRACASGRDPRADAFRTDVLSIAELDANGRTAAFITFEPNDFDAAIAELDARYLAGEAAPHSVMWSAVTQSYVALNRHELPLMTPDAVSVDHRRGRAFAPGDLPAYLEASWELMPQSLLYIADVHRLNDISAVVTQVVHGTTAEGFAAEWSEVIVLQSAGDRMSRCEMFDEEDFDTALARFDELHAQKRHPQNAATEVSRRYFTHYAAREWAAMAELVAPDISTVDRRRVVNVGSRHGRDEHMADMRSIIEVMPDVDITTAVMATRGARLVLARIRLLSPVTEGGEVLVEVLRIDEINADNRIVSGIAFDIDDIDAAFAELDARYLAGEAAVYAHTWSVIAEAYAAFNHHELPASDWATVDRRRATPFESSTMTATLRAMWDLTPDLTIHIEAVHQLNGLGAVITHTGRGTSPEGFDAEWRAVDILTVDGDSITRCEVFDEEDLGAALARLRNCTRRRRGWRTRQAKWINGSGSTSQPATGTPWRRCWPMTFPQQIVVGS